MMPSVVISARGEQRLSAGHLWIYRADIADCRAQGGDLVQVIGPRGRPLGGALFSDRSQIALRMLSSGDEAADEALVSRRIDAALDGRRLFVRLIWWSGVEPCNVLDSVVNVNNQAFRNGKT